MCSLQIQGVSTIVSSSTGQNLDLQAETHLEGEPSRSESVQSLNPVTQAMQILRDASDESPACNPAGNHASPPVQVGRSILEQAAV